MNLYGDLPPVGTGSTLPSDSKALVSQSGWSRPKMGQVPRSISIGAGSGTKSSFVGVPTSFKPRQASVTTPTAATAAVPRFTNRLAAPVISTEIVNQKRGIDDILLGKQQATDLSPIQNNAMNSSHGASFDVEDPYDPSRPNDYLIWCEERLERKRSDKLAEENKLKMAAAERARVDMERERQDAMQSGDVQRLQVSMGAGRGRGRGLSNLPAWMAQYSTPPISAPSSSSSATSMNLPSASGQFDDPENDRDQEGTAASRIMSKMGFQQGEGLGKDGKGILNPLEHKSTGQGSISQIVLDDQDRMRIASRAIAAKLALIDPDLSLSATSPGSGGERESDKEKAPKKRMGLFSNPSCVVLLKNMVAPGDVDEMLAEECKQECSKYGPVNTCIIHEITTDPDCPEEECVRTFIFFEKQESAVKAYREMNGRFFGGRQIAASFYDEGKFAKRDLGPSAGEWAN